MKAVSMIFSILLISSFSPAQAQTAQITINNIDENKSISGRVTGLDKNTLRGFRVIAYVHTDMWYIHPYAGQGEGKTWASIQDNGTWSLETVHRPFSANEIAALVVGQDYKFPDRTEAIGSVKNSGIVIKRLTGTPDFGKL